MRFVSSTFVAILATLVVAATTVAPAYAKKKSKHEPAKNSTSFSAIDESNTEVSPDESNFASSKPEKHRAAAVKEEDPINAMAAALRQPANQHRNTSVGNSSDLQPFTDFEIPR